MSTPLQTNTRALWLLGVLLALSGCTVGPDFTKPKVTVNESWSAQANARISTQAAADSLWWKAFSDPTLDRLVDLAYHQNLPLQIAGLRIVEARAQLGVATGKQWPQLQAAFASASAVGLTKYQASFANIDRNFLNYQVGFDAVWELDFWGKYRRGVEAEAASLLATVADYDSALVSLTAEVARTYAVIRTFQVLIEQAAGKRQAPGATRCRSPTARFQNGATSELDVTQATALLESTRASIPQLQISERQARNALSTLLGQRTGHDRYDARRAQGNPEGAREGGRQRAGRDAAAAPRYSQRRALRRRAVRAHRRRQGRAVSELFAGRHDRFAGQQQRRRIAQSVLDRQPVLFRRARE